MPAVQWEQLVSTDPNKVLAGKGALAPRGACYVDTVPDTLDLAEVAKTFIQGLTRSLMKDHFLTPAGHIHFRYLPYLECWGGVENWGKPAHALILARRMSGYDRDDKDGTLDIQYQSFKNMIDAHVNQELLNKGLGAWIVQPNPEILPTPMTVVLEALLELYREFPQPRLDLLIRQMIAFHNENTKTLAPEYSSNQKMLRYGETANRMRENKTISGTDREIIKEVNVESQAFESSNPAGLNGLEIYPFVNGKAMRALATWCLITGDQTSLDTITGLSNFIRNYNESWFWSPLDPRPDHDPEPLVPPGYGHFAGHIHGFLNGVMGLLWEAEVLLKQHADNENAQKRAQDFIRFATGAYTFVRGYNDLGVLGNFGEICMVGDMLRLAIKLTDLTSVDYYEDVDRWLRNQIAESQIKESHNLPSQKHPGNDDLHCIGQRVIGLFFEDATHPFAIPTPKGDEIEEQGANPCQLVACGLGNPMMGIYDAWDHIVQLQGSTARVNLLLNRASCYLDIKSHLPYRGQVEIITKSTIGPLNALEVRLPDGTDPNAVTISMNGDNLAGQWHWASSSYVHIPNLQANNMYTVSFPMVEREMEIKQVRDQDQFWTESNVGGDSSANSEFNISTRTGRFRANTLVDVNNRPSEGIQLYQRDGLIDLSEIEDPTPTRLVNRFALSPPRPVTPTYYFLRKGQELQKISLGTWPLDVIRVDAAGRIGEEWKVNTAFDFNGDGIPDIFGHNQTDGELRVWYGNPKGEYGGDVSIGKIGPEWQLQVARFVCGGGVDIFGHNRSATQNEYYQEIHVWRTNGSKIVSDTKLGNIGLEWDLQLGDFNGDGIVDILGVNTQNGDLRVWFIKPQANGVLTSIGNESFGQIGREWQLQVADMNNDGYADIFGHNANNELWVWYNVSNNNDGRGLDGGHSTGKLGIEWQQLQVTDLDGDGLPDLLGQSTSGELRGWYSNGQAFTSDSNLGSASGWIPQAGGNRLI